MISYFRNIEDRLPSKYVMGYRLKPWTIFIEKRGWFWNTNVAVFDDSIGYFTTHDNELYDFLQKENIPTKLMCVFKGRKL